MGISSLEAFSYILCEGGVSRPEGLRGGQCAKHGSDVVWGGGGSRVCSRVCISQVWVQIHATLFVSGLILQCVVRSCYGLDRCEAESLRVKRPFAVGVNWG